MKLHKRTHKKVSELYFRKINFFYKKVKMLINERLKTQK